MKKKLISSLLVLAMAFSLLTGCGGSGGNDAGGAGTSDSGSAGSDAGSETAGATSDGTTTKTSYGEYTAENPYHLTFAFVEFYNQDEAARSAVQDALNEYMVPNYHMEVEFRPMGAAEWQSTVQLMLSGGDALDVMPVFYTNAASWINMNGVFDMMPLMETADGQKIVEALGKENVLGILMPSRFSTDHSVTDAVDLAKNLGISHEILPIKEIYDNFITTLKPVFKDAPFNVAE